RASWPRRSRRSGPRRSKRSRRASSSRSPRCTLTRARSTSMSSPSAVAAQPGTRELTLSQAVNEALAEEMRRDASVFIVGEDVAEAGTPFKVLSGLVEEVRPERVIDSPISEAGISGIGHGAALTGVRHVVESLFGDILTLVWYVLYN